MEKVYNMNSKKYKRIFTVVIDSLGAGEMPDAASYGDAGTDTLGHIAANTENFKIPNLHTGYILAGSRKLSVWKKLQTFFLKMVACEKKFSCFFRVFDGFVSHHVPEFFYDIQSVTSFRK